MKNTRITSNRSAPSATVVPILVYEDVATAIEWLCGVFWTFSQHVEDVPPARWGHKSRTSNEACRPGARPDIAVGGCTALHRAGIRDEGSRRTRRPPATVLLLITFLSHRHSEAASQSKGTLCWIPLFTPAPALDTI